MTEAIWKKFMAVTLVLTMVISLMPAMTLTASAAEDEPAIIYVNEVAIGSADGSNWDNAYTTLQAALDKAKSGDHIWVAKGTYYPTSANDIVEESVEDYDRYKHFQMKNGVKIYGCFAGDEAEDYDLSTRDFTVNETILSGDIGTQGDNSDNSYRVIHNSELNSTAVLNGFTISGGNADGYYPYDSGAGMVNDNSSPTLTNVIFSGNSANRNGGGMNNDNSSPTLTNVTFSGNSADVMSYGSGGGMYNQDGSNPTIKNSIFWGNFNGQIDGPGTADITYSLIQDYTGTGAGNISDDPMFAGEGDFSLKAGSLAIDTGTSEPFEAGGAAYGVTTDLVGKPRIANNIVDMGAYESQNYIVVKAQPDKLVYTEGETLDLTGLKVTLAYNDGSTADIELADFDANGITANPANGTVMTAAAHDGKPVTLTWNSLTAATGNLTVNAPFAPTIQSAAAGDAHVNITWSSVPGATGYKIYLSTVSGLYGTALETVSNSVYSYEATGLSNGTTYFFVVRTSVGAYESANSNEISATPQVPAPGAPVLQTAVAGDGHVNLTWSEVEGSIGYKIYSSTVSDTYTSPTDTVAGSVYGCDVTGLTNGTIYNFAVKASNPGGDSGYSNEISAIPQISAPGAPTGVTATGGNAKVTLSWNSIAGATGYKIYQSTTSASYGTALTTVADSVYRYEATRLINGVPYYFVIKATNAGGDSPYSAEVTALPHRPSNSDSDRDNTPSTPSANTGVDIFVNGKAETAATATTIRKGDKTVTSVVVDAKKVEERLAQEGNNSVVTIPVKNGSDVVIGTLNGQTVKNMENMEAVLEIETENVTYIIPASQINIDTVSEQIGEDVELKEITVSIKISEPSADTVKIAEDTADKNNYQIIVNPIEFEITCSSENKTVEVSKFNAYVERMVAIPEGVDPSRITTGVFGITMTLMVGNVGCINS